MISIVRAKESDSTLLSRIGKQTIVESHGHSSKKSDMDDYVEKNYSETFFQDELMDDKNIYHIIFNDGLPAGYSKIIFNCPNANVPLQNVTKLERIYLMKEFYQMKLGQALFDFNLKLSKENSQAGMWLYVWKENQRAFNFYIKNRFRIIGDYDFKISETHSNPNYIMFLEF